MKSVRQRCVSRSREIFADMIKEGTRFQVFIGIDCIDDLISCIFFVLIDNA